MNPLLTVAAIYHPETDYPPVTDTNPPEIYPEFPIKTQPLNRQNKVYPMVRELFHLLKLDEENYGTAAWNPLKNLISPGNHVLLKPNFALDHHSKNDTIFAIITHISVIRAMIDYVTIALKGTGKITIADAPLVKTDFPNLLKINGLAELYPHTKSFGVEILDLRAEAVQSRGDVILKRIKLAGDPRGYSVVDLNRNSELYPIRHLYKKLRGSDYDIESTILHHNQEKNAYLISNTLLDADVVISLPKLKTHMKSGVTLNLKNMIGINGDKNWIPHNRVGSPQNNGDEFYHTSFFKETESKIKDKLKGMLFKSQSSIFKGCVVCGRKLYQWLFKNRFTPITSGGWYGNDTVWRSIIDLNKIVFYCDKKGKMQTAKQRKYFSLIDGIIGGEKEGPLVPSAKKCGVLLAGFDPVAADICAARLMGFDWRKIPVITNALNLPKYSFTEVKEVETINFCSNQPDWAGLLNQNNKEKYFSFCPPKGWRNYIEIYAITNKFSDLT